MFEDELVDEFTTAVRDAARFATLDSEPESEEAHGFVDDLAQRLWTFDAQRKRARPGRPFTEAVGALAADLLRTAVTDPKRYSFRTMRPEAFTGERVGYTTFKSAFDALTGLQFVQIGQRGHKQSASFDLAGGAGKAAGWGRATRFRATRQFHQMVAAYGITADEWRRHFRVRERQKTVANPIVRRSSAVRVRQEKYTGNAMRIDLAADPRARELRGQVEALNAYFVDQIIMPEVHTGFRRIFNNGDDPDFAWNKGGRLYSIGGGYQTMKKGDRLDMTLNGQPVVEIDIRASHLTILHALRGVPFDPAARDPYEVEGIPRDVVKSWVTMTLGHDRFQRAWSKKIKENLEEKLGCPLQRAYPIKETREAILEALPILADWADDPTDCFDLQFIESEIVIDTVQRLAFDHDVPCLPVHDSIIVPESNEGLARRALGEAFEARVGLSPDLVSKRADDSSR